MLLTVPSDLPASEFRRRQAMVVTEARRRGLDAIVVTDKLHVEYLTGTWGSQFWATPLILPVADSPVFLVRAYDEERVRRDGCIDDVRSYFDRLDAVRCWTQVLCELHLDRATIGLELDGGDLSPVEVMAVTAELAHVDLLDVSDVVAGHMAIKSDAEIDLMRRSMKITDALIEAFTSAASVGVSDIDLVEAMRSTAATLGAGAPRLAMLASGERVGIPHAAPSDQPLRAGDAAVVEVAGVVSGYAAALMRTLVIGANDDVSRLHTVVQAALDAAVAAMHVGVTCETVDAAARSVVERAGLASSFRHRTGYSNGLRANGRLNLSLRPGCTAPLAAGMTFHLPIHLFAEGVSAGSSETVLVTSSGPERMSGVAPGLICVPT